MRTGAITVTVFHGRAAGGCHRAANMRTNTWFSALAIPPAATQLLAALDDDGYESELEETFPDTALRQPVAPLTPAAATKLATALCRQMLRADGSGPSERDIIDHAISDGWDLQEVADQFLHHSEGREMWIQQEQAYMVLPDTGQIVDALRPTSPSDGAAGLDSPAPEPVGTPTDDQLPGSYSGAVSFTPGYKAPGHAWPLMTASYAEGNQQQRKREIYMRTEHALARTPSGLWRHCYQCTTCTDAPLFSGRDHL